MVSWGLNATFESCRSIWSGNAGVSTNLRHLSSQRLGLKALGASDDLVYVDHGLTGRTRERTGMNQTLTACRAEETPVAIRLDCLAPSLPDARDIVVDPTKRNIKFVLSGSDHDPTARSAGCCSTSRPWSPNSNLTAIRAHICEGIQISRAECRLLGSQPKVSSAQNKHLVALHHRGKNTSAEIAELFGIATSTV